MKKAQNWNKTFSLTQSIFSLICPKYWKCFTSLLPRTILLFQFFRIASDPEKSLIQPAVAGGSLLLMESFYLLLVVDGHQLSWWKYYWIWKVSWLFHFKNDSAGHRDQKEYSSLFSRHQEAETRPHGTDGQSYATNTEEQTAAAAKWTTCDQPNGWSLFANLWVGMCLRVSHTSTAMTIGEKRINWIICTFTMSETHPVL